MSLVVLGFVVYAWVRRDRPARFLALLTLAWPALFFLLVQASDEGGDPSDVLVIGVLLAFLLLPGAYLLFGQARWVQERRFAGALVTGVGALSVLPAMAIVPALLFFTANRGMPIGAMAPMPTREVWLEEEGAVGETQMGIDKALETEIAARADDERATGEAPRLRQYFPETLYWAPEVVTDENGFVSLEIPMADSITTWRLTALASSQDGRLGFTTRGVRVFQDFFVDLDLPPSIARSEEVTATVTLYNYLPQAQAVRVELSPDRW